MQQSHPAILAGGHGKHFHFLPGGELVTKKSGLREIYFYVWLCRLAGKPLLHTTSVETLVEELHCLKKPTAGAASPCTGTATEPPEEIGVGAQARLSPPQSNLCKSAQVDRARKETGSDLLDSARHVVAEGVGKKAESQAHETASTGDACPDVQHFCAEAQEEAEPACRLHCTGLPQNDSTLGTKKSEKLVACTALQDTSEKADGVKSRDLEDDHTGLTNLPGVSAHPPRTRLCMNEQNLTKQVPSVTPRDEAVWRTLLIPGFSKSRCDFERFSLEYRRQARAILPWLPPCFGTVEHTVAPPSCTPMDQRTTNEAGSPVAATAAQCATSSVSSARPTAEVVMENLLYGMRKPAVLDTKLGTKYYGEDVSAAKREKEARYARERGTYEVGMAFCGYCCGSPSEKDCVSVSGGSRASDNFKHPKTLEAFAELFQAFLMLQGDVDIAVVLGRFFARKISELILLWRSTEKKPLVNLFGTSVLLIYDAGRRGPVNVTVGEKTEGAADVTHEAERFTSRTAADEVKLGCSMENAAHVEEELKETPVMKSAGGTAVITSATGKERAVEELEDITGRVSNARGIHQKADGKSCQIAEGGSGGNLSSQCAHTTKDAITTRCEATAEDGVACVTSVPTAKAGTTGKSGEVSGRAGCSREAGITHEHSGEPPPLNAKVRIVDFAHVIVLPKHAEQGIIFGLENLRATLDLTTQSLENSKSARLYPVR